MRERYRVRGRGRVCGRGTGTERERGRGGKGKKSLAVWQSPLVVVGQANNRCVHAFLPRPLHDYLPSPSTLSPLIYANIDTSINMPKIKQQPRRTA